VLYESYARASAIKPAFAVGAHVRSHNKIHVVEVDINFQFVGCQDRNLAMTKDPPHPTPPQKRWWNFWGDDDVQRHVRHLEIDYVRFFALIALKRQERYLLYSRASASERNRSGRLWTTMASSPNSKSSSWRLLAF
jgi:hypothetical protein